MVGSTTFLIQSTQFDLNLIYKSVKKNQIFILFVIKRYVKMK